MGAVSERPDQLKTELAAVGALQIDYEALSDRVDSREARLDERLADLQGRLSDTEAVAEQVDHLRGRLDELVAKQLEADAVESQASALKERLEELQETVTEGLAGDDIDHAELGRIESEIEDYRQTLHFVLDPITARPAESEE